MHEIEFKTLYPILNNISPLSTEVWNKSKEFFYLKILKKGEHLFYMEEEVTDFYFLIEGLARYYYLTIDGKEFNKSFAEKKGHLGRVLLLV